MIAIAVPPIAAPISTRRKTGLGVATTTGDCGWKSSTPKAHAEIMKKPRPAASIRYSGQCSLNVFSITLRRLCRSESPRRKVLFPHATTHCARFPPRDEPLLDEPQPLPDPHVLSAERRLPPRGPRAGFARHGPPKSPSLL